MKKIIAFFLVPALVVVLTLTMMTDVCYAADTKDDIFINICGIDGISKDPRHHLWIDGVDFKLNYAGDGTVTGITFTHLIEPATTELIYYYMEHVWIRDAKVNICHYFAGKQYTVLDVSMQEVLITNLEVILLDDGTVAETITLKANQIAVTETPFVIGPDGFPVMY